ncbi:uncharacterized protein CG43867 [Trichonephila clavipes]|nr:uncharacterized protein CG43867 [Trichonephila clavipes]
MTCKIGVANLIQLLEQRLQGIGVTGDSYKDCIANSDQACKAQLISNLEQQVEEQKKLRILDAKKVEAKASKIKEWVTNKLKELEEQNYTLREENKKCNSQLELLKKRLSQVSQQKEKNNTEFELTQHNSWRRGWDILEILLDKALPENCSRKQTEGEGISTYIAELRALAMNCDYDKDMLNIMLRDVFVSGLRDKMILDRLFEEDNINLEKTLNIALAMEKAFKGTNDIMGRE